MATRAKRRTSLAATICLALIAILALALAITQTFSSQTKTPLQNSIAGTHSEHQPASRVTEEYLSHDLVRDSADITHIELHIRDSDSGKPVDGVVVSHYQGMIVRGRPTSHISESKSGVAIISLGDIQTTPDRTLHLTLYHPKYNHSSVKIPSEPGMYIANIARSRIINFLVLDQDDNPIPTAKVACFRGLPDRSLWDSQIEEGTQSDFASISTEKVWFASSRCNEHGHAQIQSPQQPFKATPIAFGYFPEKATTSIEDQGGESTVRLRMRKLWCGVATVSQGTILGHTLPIIVGADTQAGGSSAKLHAIDQLQRYIGDRHPNSVVLLVDCIRQKTEPKADTQLLVSGIGWIHAQIPLTPYPDIRQITLPGKSSTDTGMGKLTFHPIAGYDPEWPPPLRVLTSAPSINGGRKQQVSFYAKYGNSYRLPSGEYHIMQLQLGLGETAAIGTFSVHNDRTTEVGIHPKDVRWPIEIRISSPFGETPWLTSIQARNLSDSGPHATLRAGQRDGRKNVYFLSPVRYEISASATGVEANTIFDVQSAYNSLSITLPH